MMHIIFIYSCKTKKYKIDYNVILIITIYKYRYINTSPYYNKLIWKLL